MSRTALDGFVTGDAEKDYLLQLIRHLSSVYFVEILTFCIMGNHFHIVVRMHPGADYSDEEIKERFVRYYGDKKTLTSGEIPMFREKWSNRTGIVDKPDEYRWNGLGWHAQPGNRGRVSFIGFLPGGS